MKRHAAPRHRTAAAIIVLAVMLAACTAGSPGARLFATGQGHAGAVPRSTSGGPYATSGPGCASCHGATGQGGRIGPSIARATLGASHSITHRPSALTPDPARVTEGPWTPDQTIETVRTGKTPEGDYLGGPMPRWQLDSQDASTLAGFLGTL
jgi:hypothetical protein